MELLLKQYYDLYDSQGEKSLSYEEWKQEGITRAIAEGGRKEGFTPSYSSTEPLPLAQLAQSEPLVQRSSEDTNVSNLWNP